MRTLIWLVMISILVVVPTRAQNVEYIDPTGGYTQVVTVTDRGVKTIFVSGQVGEGEDYQAQVESAFSRVVQRLDQAGATVGDVVKMRAFVKNMTPELYRPVAEARRRTFPEGSWPASSVVGVQALAGDEFQVEMEVVAVVAKREMDLTIERFAPSNGFSGAVAVTAHGVKTVYVSGQVGQGDNLAEQTASVWQRIGERLKDAGASYADLVTETTYIVNYQPARDVAGYREGVPTGFSSLPDKAASTWIGVPSLANERFLIEIDAVAVVEAGGGPVEKEFIEPTGPYSQAVSVMSPGGLKTIYVSGQVGSAGEPLVRQTDQAYANLRRHLEAAGGSPADLLKATVYIPDYSEADLGVLGPAREKHGFMHGMAPASTLLRIQSLFSSGFAIEVGGVAVVGR